MIRKLMIANRGEVAVRIARACTELDIESVAIFTDTDRDAPHVQRADCALHVGDDPLRGYLDVHGLVQLALRSGCDALHPGYGFLADNAELAQACARRGIAFVGPPGHVLRSLQDTAGLRRALRVAGVPIVPGSDTSVTDAGQALLAARALGYPVVLASTVSRGSARLCRDDRELVQGYGRVAAAANRELGRAEARVEKAIADPLHIEVQILADKYGNAIHLYERDSSVRHRHRRLVGIAPSPRLTELQRREVCALALRVARAVGYENAGTVEFLCDAEGRFYFRDLTARLQVEHTVTEQVTGVDIVQQQIRIADGKTLSWRQSAIHAHGYAIQFHIDAEDPKNGFMPSFGRIQRYQPPGGPGVCTEAAICSGYDFPPHYDSLCAKVAVWAPSWEGLLARARRALLDLTLHGLKTTAPLHLEILKAPEFRAARFDARFVEHHPELLNYKTPPDFAARPPAARSVGDYGLRVYPH